MLKPVIHPIRIFWAFDPGIRELDRRFWYLSNGMKLQKEEEDGREGPDGRARREDLRV